MIDELFTDTVVISHHEKLFTLRGRIPPLPIQNEFGHFHPHLRPARKARRPVDGLFASPLILVIITINSNALNLTFNTLFSWF